MVVSVVVVSAVVARRNCCLRAADGLVIWHGMCAYLLRLGDISGGLGGGRGDGDPLLSRRAKVDAYYHLRTLCDLLRTP